jgi:hypothetical protein
MTKEQQTIKKIKDWLEDVKEPDEYELDDIDKGWLECSQSLLEQIEKWEVK